jgi:hypothetical protein
MAERGRKEELEKGTSTPARNRSWRETEADRRMDLAKVESCWRGMVCGERTGVD